MKNTMRIILCLLMAAAFLALSACGTGAGSTAPAAEPSAEPTANAEESAAPSEEPAASEEPVASEVPVASEEPAADENASPIVASEGEGTGTGKATAKVKGFGGDVLVTVTVDKGIITEVVAEGAAETAEIGGKALVDLSAAITEKGDFEVDAVAGATVTSNAVLEAGQLAYEYIMGQAD